MYNNFVDYFFKLIVIIYCQMLKQYIDSFMFLNSYKSIFKTDIYSIYIPFYI